MKTNFFETLYECKGAQGKHLFIKVRITAPPPRSPNVFICLCVCLKICAFEHYFGMEPQQFLIRGPIAEWPSKGYQPYNYPHHDESNKTC